MDHMYKDVLIRGFILFLGILRFQNLRYMMLKVMTHQMKTYGNIFKVVTCMIESCGGPFED